MSRWANRTFGSSPCITGGRWLGGRIRESKTFDGDAQLRRRTSWISIAIIDAAIVAWGLLALVNPEILTAGFESRTSGSWQAFAGREPEAGEFVLIAFGW